MVLLNKPGNLLGGQFVWSPRLFSICWYY